MIPFKDTIPRIGIPWITWILILLNAIIFIFEISIPKGALEEVFLFFGLVPAKVFLSKMGIDSRTFSEGLFPLFEQHVSSRRLAPHHMIF